MEISQLNENEIIKNLNDLLQHNYLEDVGYLREENDYIVYNNAIRGLLDLYQQEKEKNKGLLKQLEEKEKEVVLVPEGTCFMMKPKNVVSKDKIRAKIKELEEKSDYWNCDEIEVLKELLLEE